MDGSGMNEAAGAIERLTRNGDTLFAALAGDHTAGPGKRRKGGRLRRWLARRRMENTTAAGRSNARREEPVMELAREYHASGRIPGRSGDGNAPVNTETASLVWGGLVNLLSREEALRQPTE